MTTVRILSLALSTSSSSIITLLMVEICRSSTDWNSRCSIRGSSFTLMIMWSIIRQKKSQMSGNDGLKLMSTFSMFSCCKLIKKMSDDNATQSTIQIKVFLVLSFFFLISWDICVVAIKYSASFLHIYNTVMLLILFLLGVYKYKFTIWQHFIFTATQLCPNLQYYNTPTFFCLKMFKKAISLNYCEFTSIHKWKLSHMHILDYLP